MRAVYIAGPMRGHKDFNFPAFFAAEDRLMSEAESSSVVVFNPARRDVENHGEEFAVGTSGKLEEIPQFDLRDALGYDLDWICKHASEVHLLKGWSSSKGATAERATALALGLTVTYEDPYEDQTMDEALAYDDGYAFGHDDGMGWPG